MTGPGLNSEKTDESDKLSSIACMCSLSTSGFNSSILVITLRSLERSTQTRVVNVKSFKCLLYKDTADVYVHAGVELTCLALIPL